MSNHNPLIADEVTKVEKIDYAGIWEYRRDLIGVLSIINNEQRAGRYSYNYNIREQSPQTTHLLSRLQPYVICLIMHSAYCCFDFRQYVRS